MDRVVTYTLCIDIPFNKETSRAFSESIDVNMALIQHAVNHIQNMISVYGVISLERIFRCFEMREQPIAPHIFFSEMDNCEFEEDEDGGILITLWMVHSFELLPMPENRKNKHLRKDAKKILTPDFTKPESEEETCPAAPKETSGSGENGTT